MFDPLCVCAPRRLAICGLTDQLVQARCDRNDYMRWTAQLEGHVAELGNNGVRRTQGCCSFSYKASAAAVRSLAARRARRRCPLQLCCCCPAIYCVLQRRVLLRCALFRFYSPAGRGLMLPLHQSFTLSPRQHAPPTAAMPMFYQAPMCKLRVQVSELAEDDHENGTTSYRKPMEQMRISAADDYWCVTRSGTGAMAWPPCSATR